MKSVSAALIVAAGVLAMMASLRGGDYEARNFLANFGQFVAVVGLIGWWVALFRREGPKQ